MKSSSKDKVYYVIVVHGIGEQKLNSTVTPVINRFAEVIKRVCIPQKEKAKDLIPLGMVTAQTGNPRKLDDLTFFHEQPWAEFENIRADGVYATPFEPTAGTSGENIRFTEMYWADILNDNFKISGQDVLLWSETLINRLENRNKDDETWLLEFLKQVNALALLFYRLLSLRTPGVKELVFQSFLGDVQIYGENPWVRGQACARFHNLMNKISDHHQEKNPDKEAQYIILSHSLGTVLALDTLGLAHYKKEILAPEVKDGIPNIPFPGFGELFQEKEGDNQERIGEKWIDQVSSLVTLGSPLDKFLALWPANYAYLNEMYKSGDGAYFVIPRKKIQHYNYCDEQDPVGHKLEILRRKDKYDLIFENTHEEIFHRYSVPGLAHNLYWQDADLFERIYQDTINPEFVKQADRIPKKERERFKKSPLQYWKSVFNSYLFFPLLSVPVSTFLFLWGWRAAKRHSWELTILIIFALIGSTYLFRKLTSLSIWWRQTARLKAMEGQVYAQKDSADFFKMVTTVLMLILAWLCLLYVSGSVQLMREWSYYKDEIYYIESIMGMSFALLLFQYFSKVGEFHLKLRRAWTISEVKTLFWFFLLVGACLLLGNSAFFKEHLMIHPAFYWDGISFIILNTSLTMIYVMVYYYDVNRRIKDLDFH